MTENKKLDSRLRKIIARAKRDYIEDGATGWGTFETYIIAAFKSGRRKRKRCYCYD